VPFALAEMAPRSRSPKRRRVWPLVVLALVLLAGGGVAVYALTRSDQQPVVDSTATLVADCQEQARGKLKSPSTARFPGGEQVEQTGNTIRITGPVDAQNSFGAMLRGRYRCVATRQGDTWSVYSVELLN
jgi:hypothetical protein